MDDSLKKAQRKYEQTEKAKIRRKKYKLKPDVQIRQQDYDSSRDRTEYMRNYMREYRPKPSNLEE